MPGDVLHLLPGDGAAVGAPLVADPRIAGVAFTGSTETARAINRVLAAKDGPIVPLIAETGGQNAMIVDSSALPEQVVRDAVVSGFQSAGQRCSALRVLFVQQDIAPKLTEMLAGAMAELKVGDPALLSTDVGPVIDEDARTMLEKHAARMAREGELIHETQLGADCRHGHFFAPRAYEIDSLRGSSAKCSARSCTSSPSPATAWTRCSRRSARTGYGLTLGIHSRIDGRAEYIVEPAARRQRLCQPQHDRRGGRRAALRRRGPLRHRAQGRRPALPATASRPSARFRWTRRPPAARCFAPQPERRIERSVQSGCP